MAYTFSNPDAKALLYLLKDAGREPYEDVRQLINAPSETFKRITRRLTQFDLVRMRAPKGSEFEGRRIRVVLELSPRGERVVPVLRDLDGTLKKHKTDVPETVERLVV